jgi:hypothetical protein
MDYKEPQIPVFTHLWLEDQMADNAAKGKKPQAFDTPFRYSDSGKCARALAYSALGYEGEPFDAAGTLVTGLGTYIHELAQEAILKRYPDAKFEIPTRVATSSGHCDGIIETEEYGRVLYELKTMNGTAYRRSMGLNINSWAKSGPEGPRISTILQSALNAQANDCDTIIIGHIALEAVGKGVAKRLDVDEWSRIITEFVIPKEVWEPAADQEMNRQSKIIEKLDEGRLPKPVAVDKDFELVDVDPHNDKFWQCGYCSYRDQCVSDGPGEPVFIREEINNG